MKGKTTMQEHTIRVYNIEEVANDSEFLKRAKLANFETIENLRKNALDVCAKYSEYASGIRKKLSLSDIHISYGLCSNDCDYCKISCTLDSAALNTLTHKLIWNYDARLKIQASFNASSKSSSVSFQLENNVHMRSVVFIDSLSAELVKRAKIMYQMLLAISSEHYSDDFFIESFKNSHFLLSGDIADDFLKDIVAYNQEGDY